MTAVHWNFIEISAKYFSFSVISVYQCWTVTFFVDISSHISQFCLFYTPNVSLAIRWNKDQIDICWCLLVLRCFSKIYNLVSSNNFFFFLMSQIVLRLAKMQWNVWDLNINETFLICYGIHIQILQLLILLSTVLFVPHWSHFYFSFSFLFSK